MTRRYSKSTARAEFESALSEIETVILRVAPPRRVDPALKNYVLGAAILFLSAKIENYISDLFNSICQEACRTLLTPDAAPPALLGWAFLNDGHIERSKTFVARNNESEYILETGNYLINNLLRDPGKYLTPDKFTGINDKSYPSAKNLKRMFRRIGIDSVFNRLDCRLRRNTENDLASLNSIRGSLAHTGISGILSYNDVRSQLRKMNQIVRGLDMETFYHLRRCHSGIAWKS
ncbi:HEPN domain-containing protein [Schlesneria sp.]|uniref:HEPN domain-containing protein n=1 Tax=Schlesneria sp. TaxID=2762018 RepID=UPI003F7FA669